jgi:lysozyme
VTDQDRAALRQQLVRHEGLRLKPYRCPVGKLTIGVGRNLDDCGITDDEAMTLLDHDIDRCVRQLAGRFTWFPDLDPVRQRALVDLCFNVGFTALLDFKQTLAAVGRGDYTSAGTRLRDSRWYQQVGARGPRVVTMLTTGQEPT